MSIPELADKLRCKHTKDAYNDPVIEGKRGNIHQDGTGFGVAVMLGSIRAMNFAHEVLRTFLTRRQHGDSECVYFMFGEHLTAEQIAMLVKYVGIRQRKQLTPEARAVLADRLRSNLSQTTAKQGTSASKTS